MLAIGHTKEYHWRWCLLSNTQFLCGQLCADQYPVIILHHIPAPIKLLHRTPIFILHHIPAPTVCHPTLPSPSYITYQPLPSAIQHPHHHLTSHTSPYRLPSNTPIIILHHILTPTICHPTLPSPSYITYQPLPSAIQHSHHHLTSNTSPYRLPPNTPIIILHHIPAPTVCYPTPHHHLTSHTSPYRLPSNTPIIILHLIPAPTVCHPTLPSPSYITYQPLPSAIQHPHHHLTSNTSHYRLPSNTPIIILHLIPAPTVCHPTPPSSSYITYQPLPSAIQHPHLHLTSHTSPYRLPSNTPIIILHHIPAPTVCHPTPPSSSYITYQPLPSAIQHPHHHLTSHTSPYRLPSNTPIIILHHIPAPTVCYPPPIIILHHIPAPTVCHPTPPSSSYI